jgi:molybdopterin-binding protein
VSPLPSLSFLPLPFSLFLSTDLQENPMSIQAINVRNQFKGKVREIIRGDVVSEVDVETPWGIVTSVITTRSVDDLNLIVGSDVVALVKSTEVSIAKL